MNDLQAMEPVETMTVLGQAAHVVDAHEVARAKLKEVLGPDSIDSWHLKVMEHVHVDDGSLQFNASFVRVGE